MNPKMLLFAFWAMLEAMLDFVKLTSLDCISTLFFFNIILPSGICLLMEHDANNNIVISNIMIFEKKRFTILQK